MLQQMAETASEASISGVGGKRVRPRGPLDGYVTYVSRQSQQEMQEMQAELFYECNLPQNLAEHPKWKSFLKRLNSAYAPLSRCEKLYLVLLVPVSIFKHFIFFYNHFNLFYSFALTVCIGGN